MSKDSASDSTHSKLGEREVQILSLAADGFADKEIATQLDISFTTVRSYWERIRDKLGAVNRAHAVALGMPHNRVERGREELDGFILRAISDEAIFACSSEGVLLSWNKGVKQLFGYEEPEWIGQHASMFFTDEEKMEAARELSDAQTAGTSINDRWHLRKDGGLFWGTNIVISLESEYDRAAYVKIVRPKPEPTVP